MLSVRSTPVDAPLRARRRRAARTPRRPACLGTYLHTRDTLRDRSAEVHALAARKHQLETRLAQIEEGSSLVRGARRLGLVKPGEHLFIVQGISELRRAHSRK